MVDNKDIYTNFLEFLLIKEEEGFRFRKYHIKMSFKKYLEGRYNFEPTANGFQEIFEKAVYHEFLLEYSNLFFEINSSLIKSDLRSGKINRILND